MSAFTDAVAHGAAALGVPVDGAALERMAAHQSLLERWAPRVNLVADPAPSLTAERHFVDSLALLRLLDPVAASPPHGAAPTLTDVGAGAGFPGLVLAAARPERPVTLVEPIGRRSSFLATCAAAMGLHAVQVVTGRLDAVPAGTLPLVVSRAVLAPPAWLTAAARALAPGGRVIRMGAAPPDDEERAAAAAAALVEEARDTFTLPSSGAARVNIMYRGREA